MIAQINKLLSEREWYDNSKLSTILTCKRLAYWHYKFQNTGLATRVGPGANYGSCIHKALETYYNSWGKASLEERQARAFRAFVQEHNSQFPDDAILANKHTIDRGLIILGEYFDRFTIEDESFEPVENELGAIITISPQDGDPSSFKEPFLYVVRLDGLWKRKSDGSLWVKETKTTSGPPIKEVQRLKLARQIYGYCYAMRQWEPKRVEGVLVDVLQVAAEKLEYARDFIPLSQQATNSWRNQTVAIVEDWRKLQSAAGLPYDNWTVLDHYYMNDGACQKYGLCTFFDLCMYGPGVASDIEYPANKWTPFKIMEDAAL